MTKEKDPKPRLAFVETPLTAEEDAECVYQEGEDGTLTEILR